MRALLVILLSGSSFIYAENFHGAKQSCLAFLAGAHKALVDSNVTISKPYQEFRESTDPSHPVDLNSFENAVQEVYLAAVSDDPSLQQVYNWDQLASRFSLSRQQRDILESYYSLLIFNDVPVGPRRIELLEAVSRMSLANRLKLNPDLRKRYTYYKKNMTKLSARQMAEELGISQGKVYEEVNSFNLSFVEAFKGDLGDGRTEAQRWARHHAGIELHGTAWDRVLEYEGKAYDEQSLLIRLYESGLSYDEIVQKLNTLPVIESGSATKQARTHASVGSRLSELGITKEINSGEENIRIEGYGLVKCNGNLDPILATLYLSNNSTLSIETLAQRLNMTENSLRKFIRYRHLESLFKGQFESPRPSSDPEPPIETIARKPKLSDQEVQIRNLQKRVQVNNALLDHIAGSGVIPVQKNEFWNNNNIDHQAYFGTGEYREGEVKSKSGLNANQRAAISNLKSQWESSKSRFTPEQNNKIFIALRRLSIDYSSKEEKQPIVADAVIERMHELKGVFPDQTNSIWKELGIKQSEFLGTGESKAGGSRRHLAVHDDPKDAAEKLRSRWNLIQKEKKWTAEERQQVDYAIKRQEIETGDKNYKRQEMAVFVIGRMGETGEFPVAKDRIWKQFSISWAKYTASADYKLDGSRSSDSIYPSYSEAIADLELRWQKLKTNYTEKQQVNVERVFAKEKFELKTKDEQREIVDLSILQSMAKTGFFPLHKDPLWKSLFINRDRYMNRPQDSVYIYLSQKDALAALRARWKLIKDSTSEKGQKLFDDSSIRNVEVGLESLEKK